MLFMGHTATAGTGIESEIHLGPATATVADTVNVGLGIGGGLNIPVHTFSAGAVEVRGAVMPVFGSAGNQGLDITQMHIPLGVAIAFLERPASGQGMGLGGGVGVGMMTTVGRWASSGVTVGPYITMDLVFGVFERGALKLRYTAVLREASSDAGSVVRYQSLVVIGSTSW